MFHDAVNVTFTKLIGAMKLISSASQSGLTFKLWIGKLAREKSKIRV